MLLSFERPACRRWPEDFGPRSSAAAPDSSADLENCTVANDTSYHRANAFGRSPKITVKIVRAHGGCLGTKSR
jgi:hypothetical protein